MILLSPFDLHVLGTPPAFILSQDQTLRYLLCPVGQQMTEVICTGSYLIHAVAFAIALLLSSLFCTLPFHYSFVKVLIRHRQQKTASVFATGFGRHFSLAFTIPTLVSSWPPSALRILQSLRFRAGLLC